MSLERLFNTLCGMLKFVTDVGICRTLICIVILISANEVILFSHCMFVSRIKQKVLKPIFTNSVEI